VPGPDDSGAAAVAVSAGPVSAGPVSAGPAGPVAAPDLAGSPTGAAAPTGAAVAAGQPEDPGPGRVRVRIRYAKVGKVRFTGHRDVVRMWERAFRRIGLPVAWSEGFSPHPLISFGLALPTGAESWAEYLDVVLRAPPAIDHLPQRLSSLLPAGVDALALETLGKETGSLQQEVSSCSWKLEVLGLAAEELASRVERLLAAPSVLVERERKGRTIHDDLRPAVLSLAISLVDDVPPGGATRPGGAWINAELATRPRGVRPRELLEGLGPDLTLSRACRMHQWIERDGARWEPLEHSGHDARAGATHATERAS
jgi:radical SAM-linked protein